MSSLSKHHRELTDGKGKCSVPMWIDHCPAGFCDRDAFGNHCNSAVYNGYVPALACIHHGGPESKS